MRVKRVLSTGLVGVALVAMSACTNRAFTPQPGWTQLPGAEAMWRFCDGPMLFYVSVTSTDEDNVEAVFAGWCEYDQGSQTWKPALGAPQPGQVIEPSTQGQLTPGASRTPLPGEDTNQQDERDEEN
jgi:hypothetical protein